MTFNSFLQQFSKAPSQTPHGQKASQALLFPKVGNSLVEYALPLAIVGIAVLAGVASLGTNFNQSLPLISNGTFGTGTEAKTIRMRPLGSNPYTQIIQITLADGKTIELDNYPTDIKSLVETLGPNGTTELLVDALRQMAQKLLAKGEITQDQANQLSNLANSGHTLAAFQAFFEDAAAKSGNDSKAFAKIVKPLADHEAANLKYAKDIDPSVLDTFGIKPLTGTFLYDANGNVVRDTQGNYVTTDQKLGASLYSPEVADFVNTFGKAQQSGALQDKVVRDLVISLSQNIYSLGHFSFSVATQVSVPQFQLSPSQFNQKVSEPINKDSANICATGGGKDSGVYCPSSKNGRS
ncbi:MAG: hypothetical protein K2X66_13735 [Cyanobacteria bacterium]|nr:hypothetical protein [Cyanobacteriota bacterium]